MATAREAFIAKKLSTKMGIKGRVAARYVEAGYRVRIDPPLEGVDFTASKKGMRIAGIIVSGKKTVDAELVERAAKIGEKYSVKPVIILYGSGPTVSEEAVGEAKEKGIGIRRIRG